MEHNIADLIADAFSEVDIDFADFQGDEDTNLCPTQLVMDEDMDDMNGASKLCTTSEQGTIETFTKVYEQEEIETSDDNSEGESNNLFTMKTESTVCLSHEIPVDNDQVVKMMMTEAQQQINHTAGDCAAQEGNMQSDLAGVSRHVLLTEFSITGDDKEVGKKEHFRTLETFNVEYQPKASPPMSSESQTPEETSSESDEESPENCSTTEQSSQCESLGNKDEHFLPMSPNIADQLFVRDDMKEFTEEDQEQIEESLADYPSDLSHSETEEPAENATAQPFTLIDIRSRDDLTTDKMEDLSRAENVSLQNKDSPALDRNSGIKDLEVELISASADLDLAFQRGRFDEDHVQESVANNRKAEDDVKNEEDAEELSDVKDQVDYISDSSSDEHSTNQEEINVLSSVKQEEEKNHAIQHNYSVENMVSKDDNIAYICPDTGDRDANSPEKQDIGSLLVCDVEQSGFTITSSISHYEESNAEPTELHCSIESLQSDPAIKDHDKSFSEASANVGDTKNVWIESFCSSALQMDEDYLCLDKYDWDLTGEDAFKINSGEGENQEYTEEALEDLDIDGNKEGYDRDWELEKPRIEAFYRFYGDQAEPEDKAGRIHKVTFRLDQESSEYDEESDSTKDELDSDLNTADLHTLKPEFTEEDQEQIEESLPDYPSDLSHSETEEPAENATAQPFTLIDISSRDDLTTDKMEDLSRAENVSLQNKDSPALDRNSGIKDLEVELISASADLDLDFQRGRFDEDHVQESVANNRKAEDDVKNEEDAEELSDVKDQVDYISDSSSDEHSTNQEETNVLSSVKQEEEKNHAIQHNYSVENMVSKDDNIAYICPDTGDRDANSPEKQDVGSLLVCDVEESGFTITSSNSHYEESNAEPTELHCSIESLQSDPAIKDHDKSFSEASANVGDTKNVWIESFCSSALQMDEDYQCLDKYDWDLTGEDAFKINSGEGENQEYTEEALEDLDIDGNKEGYDRDWELEKPRIMAFYRFYGDQAEPEDKAGRNQKVTFRLDQESSEYDEESDSTEEELDSDLNTAAFHTLKPEYNTESDDSLEKPHYPDWSRMQPKQQQPVSAAVKKHPHRNKCLAVLKSALALGLLTTIGIVSFWWARENLDWIH